MGDVLRISIEASWLDIIQSLATIAAFTIGAIWSYLMFIQKRQKYPRTRLEQKVQHRPLPEGKTLLFVDIELFNVGDVLITAESMFSQVEKIFPLDHQDGEFYTLKREEGETEFPWQWAQGGDRLMRKFDSGEIEIEPSESQPFHYEFIITEPIETVKIYSYIQNYFKRKPSLGEIIEKNDGYQELPKDKEIGWSITTLYDVTGGSDGKETSSTETTKTT